jgi:hypothetical protein
MSGERYVRRRIPPSDLAARESGMRPDRTSVTALHSPKALIGHRLGTCHDLKVLNEIGDTAQAPVTVHIQLTEADVVEALRYQLMRNRSLYIVPITGLLVGGLGVIGLLAGNGGVGGALIGVGAYLLIWFGFHLWRAPGRSWRKDESIRDPQTVTFSDEGVEARTILSESRSNWGLFVASSENEHSYMLRLASRKTYQIVPKRCLASPTDELILRRLFEAYTEAHLRTD